MEEEGETISEKQEQQSVLNPVGMSSVNCNIDKC